MIDPQFKAPARSPRRGLSRPRFAAWRILAVIAPGLLLAGCGNIWPRQPKAPPPTPPQVDTVIVIREVPPPLPEAQEHELCLSTGMAARIWVTPTGDTLVTDRRISARELGPGITFEGAYAESQPWFVRAQPIRFERREYRKSGVDGPLECAGLKQVGMHEGVPLFADLLEVSPLRTLHVPVRPGMFQTYIRR